MIEKEITYESVLSRLRQIPVEALPEVDAYLEGFMPNNGLRGKNREAIISLAGSWGEMSDVDFQEYLSEAKT